MFLCFCFYDDVVIMTSCTNTEVPSILKNNFNFVTFLQILFGLRQKIFHWLVILNIVFRVSFSSLAQKLIFYLHYFFNDFFVRCD